MGIVDISSLFFILSFAAWMSLVPMAEILFSDAAIIFFILLFSISTPIFSLNIWLISAS